MIIFAFPGVGKTTLSQKYQSVIDLELSEIKYDNSQVSHLTKEERKSLKRPLKSEDYRQVYVQKALDLHHQGKVVLAALNFLLPILREMRNTADRDYHIFVPKVSLRKSYKHRYLKRGNNHRFLREVMAIWYPTTLVLGLFSLFLPHKITILQSGQVLEDFFDAEQESFRFIE